MEPLNSSHKFWTCLTPMYISESKRAKSLIDYFIFFLSCFGFYWSIFILSHCCYLLFSYSVPSDSLWPHELQWPGFPVLHDLPEFAQTNVLWIGDAIQPSHPLHSLLLLKRHLNYTSGIHTYEGNSLIILIFNWNIFAL